MNKVLLCLIALVVMACINIADTLWRKKVMLGYQGFFPLLFNWQVWAIIFLCFVSFGISFFAINLTSLNTFTILSWFLVVPTFLTTLFLSRLFFSEIISPSQYKWVGLLLVSMIISGIGTIMLVRGK